MSNTATELTEFTAIFTILKDATGVVQDALEAVLAVKAVVSVPGAVVSTGCPETGAAIGVIGAETALWIVELIYNLEQTYQALEVTVQNYEAAEAANSSATSQVSAGATSSAPATAPTTTTPAPANTTTTSAAVPAAASVQTAAQSGTHVETALASGVQPLTTAAAAQVSGAADAVSTVAGWGATATQPGNQQGSTK